MVELHKRGEGSYEAVPLAAQEHAELEGAAFSSFASLIFEAFHADSQLAHLAPGKACASC